MIVELVSLVTAAPGDNIENIIINPYSIFQGAFGSLLPVIIFSIFMTGIIMIYIKTQSVAPSLVAFIMGSMVLGTILPAEPLVQKFMFLMAALGIVGMLYYAFARRAGE